MRPSRPSHTNTWSRSRSGEWILAGRSVSAPSGGGPPAPTRVVRVVSGCGGAPSRTAAETPCPRCSAAGGSSRLARLLQLPVVGLHLRVPAQHPPRQEVGSLLQRGRNGAPLAGRLELPGLHVHRRQPPTPPAGGGSPHRRHRVERPGEQPRQRLVSQTSAASAGWSPDPAPSRPGAAPDLFRLRVASSNCGQLLLRPPDPVFSTCNPASSPSECSATWLPRSRPAPPSAPPPGTTRTSARR